MRSGDKSALKMKGDRSPVLRLTDMKPGNYRFSLTVTDAKRLKDTDYVEVTVLPGRFKASKDCLEDMFFSIYIFCLYSSL
jgi:hypothetical protein